MALRSPVPFHNFWGTSNPLTAAPWTSGTLPNEGAVPAYQSPNLQAGDFAYVAADTTFYLCTDPGVGQINAVWVALVVGPTADADRFAPKYLVGGPNDTASALAGVGGFWFFPDTGDGAGIEAALAQAAILPGDVWVRPGTFDLTGVAALPLVVPAGVCLRGAGPTSNGTILAYNVPSAAVGTAIILNGGSELRDLKVLASDASDASGNGVVEVNVGERAHCERVEVELDRDPASTSTLLAAFFTAAGAELTQDRCSVVLVGTGGGEELPPEPLAPAVPPPPRGSTWTVGTLGGEDFADLATALASGSVVNGDRLLVSAQTFTTASTITVAKQVTIQGAALASTIIQTAGAAGDPVVVIEVTTDNVVIRDLTVKQRKTTNTSIETAISINPPGGGAGSTGHFLEAVRVETMEFGVVIRSDGWQINNCQLAYVGPNNSTRRLVGVYRSGVQGIFANTTYDSGQDGVITGSTRVFNVLATTGLPTEVLGGYLGINNITPSNAFPVQQFFNCEWFQPAASPLSLYVTGCTSAETSAFLVWTCTNTQPPLSQSLVVVLTGNTITNSHGKGLYSLNGAHAVIGNPGATTFWAQSNTLGATAFLGTWASGVSAPANATEAAQLGYDTVRWNNPNQPLAGGVTPPTIETALTGWRTNGPLRLDLCDFGSGDAGVIGTDDVDVDQSRFADFNLVGIYCVGADLAVTGGTKVSSSVAGAKGIQAALGQGAATALINARVNLANTEGGGEVGIELDVDSGQVTGSRVEASSGIVSSNAAGRGVAIGFNNVISQAGQQISAQLVDEVAHNILST
jgi:hypothetical protein